MSKIQEEKKLLRKKVEALKKSYTNEELVIRSIEVQSVIEITGVFQSAKNILIYNGMNDEVQTLDFIDRWKNEKNFYLPVVSGDDLFFKRYISSSSLEKSDYGIWEPTGDNFTDYKTIDLIIIPGVAFDRNKNRLGRGKGFYDRFLKNVEAPKMGICFEFQLLDKIPVKTNDIKMDYIVSENDFIW